MRNRCSDLGKYPPCRYLGPFPLTASFGVEGAFQGS